MSLEIFEHLHKTERGCVSVVTPLLFDSLKCVITRFISTWSVIARVKKDFCIVYVFNSSRNDHKWNFSLMVILKWFYVFLKYRLTKYNFYFTNKYESAFVLVKWVWWWQLWMKSRTVPPGLNYQLPGNEQMSLMLAVTNNRWHCFWKMAFLNVCQTLWYKKHCSNVFVEHMDENPI